MTLLRHAGSCAHILRAARRYIHTAANRPYRSEPITSCVPTTGQSGPKGPRVIIFDCNGVLVDSAPIAMSVDAEELQDVGLRVTPEIVARYFTGRRPVDMFADVEAATGIRLPTGFAAQVARRTLARLQIELRSMPHVVHALTWLRGPKAVASSSPIDRVRVSLECTDLLRFFESNVFSASSVLK